MSDHRREASLTATLTLVREYTVQMLGMHLLYSSGESALAAKLSDLYLDQDTGELARLWRDVAAIA